MTVPTREEEWAIWLHAAMSGDAVAYRRFRGSVTSLRVLVRRRVTRARLAVGDADDVVQELLLAIHSPVDLRDRAE